MGGPNEVRAKFPSMEEGTQEDWQIIGGHFGPFASKVADRVLDHLKLLDGDFGGFPIDRMQHSVRRVDFVQYANRLGLIVPPEIAQTGGPVSAWRSLTRRE